MDARDRIVGGIIGLLAGDALGLPVEFESRLARLMRPVKEMTGYGVWRKPAGTWSDDGSLTLATVESLLEKKALDLEDVMRRFSLWMNKGHLSATGKAFDIGNTTKVAIANYDRAKPIEDCGLKDEKSNGNGSLMRMLPVALFYHRHAPNDVAKASKFASAITHAHLRSRLCCAYYSILVKGMMEGQGLTETMKLASEEIKPSLNGKSEERVFDRLVSGKVLSAPSQEIKAGGHVIDTLEASLWCCHKHDNFKDAVLEAVNLGDDADTTGAVTGGLAGVMYGIGGVPEKWQTGIARASMAREMAEKFAELIGEQP